MRAGTLDQRITISRGNVTGQNTFGEDVTATPAVVCSAWAEVKYLEGRELERAMQVDAEARYRITIRSRPDISILRSDWLVWNGQTLDIIDVQGPGTREECWKILAKDHVS